MEIILPELLCPAGGPESFYAAVNNGADAVYMGGKLFNARNSADNFSSAEFEEMLSYAHLRGVDIHLTLNTLYKNSEMKDVFIFAEEMYKAGVDSFILQDIGTAVKLMEYFPGIKINASTQMSVHSLAGVKYFEELGFNRVVLSRELSLAEVKEIKASAGIEIETFIHGALCACYSGQCLMSSIIGGRSGNRGRCAQPCRMYYSLEQAGKTVQEGYLLSPRDIITLEILGDLVSAGIDSLKIEGRMKSPEYVATVTKAYREALDAIKAGDYQADPLAIKEATQIFNRGGGSTTGYYYNFSGFDMMSPKTPKSTGLYVGQVVGRRGSKCVIKLSDSVIPGDGVEIWTSSKDHPGAYVNKKAEAGDIVELLIKDSFAIGDKVYKSFGKEVLDKASALLKNRRHLNIHGEVRARIGRPLSMTLKYGNLQVTEYGDICEEAQNMPLTREKIVEQLSKTLNTPYKVVFDSADVDDGIFIPVSALNSLRRVCVEKFGRLHVQSFKRESGARFDIAFDEEYVLDKKLTVQVQTLEQLKGAVTAGAFRVYYPVFAPMDGVFELCQSHNCQLFIYLPRISRNDENRRILEKMPVNGAEGYLVSTYGQLKMLRDMGAENIVLDFSFNIFNSLSSSFFASQGITACLSPELSIKDMARLGGSFSEVIIHGRQTLMATHLCPVGIYAGGKKEGKYCALRNSGLQYTLTDRKNMEFPVVTDCESCTAYILNSQTLCMLNKIEDVLKLNVRYVRLVLTDESQSQCEDTVAKYAKAVKTGTGSRFNGENLTNGHFYRGVL